jgi:hypothetical protein
MANETIVVENLKDSPDLAVLKQMEAPVVVVIKLSPSGKKAANQLVVNGATGMNWQQILDLHDQLPLGTMIPNSGPGLYKFEVTDANTTAKVSWQIRLGSGVTSEVPAASNEVARSPFSGGVPAAVLAAVPAAVASVPVRPAPAVPPAPDAQNLGNGWVYNPSQEILTAPNGEMFIWRKGMDMPKMTPSSPVVSTAPAVPQPMFTSSTAASPEYDAMRQTLAATQAALAEAREAEKERARREEIRALQAQTAKALEESNKRFEALVQTLTKPERNSEVEELKRRLEESDRRREESERAAALRVEMQAQQAALEARLREMAPKGPDPMIGVLTEMLKDQRHSAEENIRSLRELMLAERQAARETTLTPEKLLTMLERQAMLNKDDSKAEMASKMFSSFDMLMERMLKITQMEREMGGASGGVDWMSVIKEIGSKAGSAMQMFQAAKAQEARAAAAQAEAVTAKAHAVAAQAQTRGRALPAGAAPAVPVSQAAEGGPAPVPPKRQRPQVVPPKLEDAKVPELRALFKGEKDELFFGGSFEFVRQLRDEVASKPTEHSAEDIAGYILQAREIVAAEAEKGNIPHAAELMAANQYGYLLERILPTASEGLRSEIVKSIQAALTEEESAARIAANTANSEAPSES